MPMKRAQTIIHNAPDKVDEFIVSLMIHKEQI